MTVQMERGFRLYFLYSWNWLQPFQKCQVSLREKRPGIEGGFSVASSSKSSWRVPLFRCFFYGSDFWDVEFVPLNLGFFTSRSFYPSNELFFKDPHPLILSIFGGFRCKWLHCRPSEISSNQLPPHQQLPT